MGYYTEYDLEIFTKNGERYFDSGKIQNEIQEKYRLAFGDSIKWYEYKVNMIEFSKKYPELILVISGDGEDFDDKWKHYFLNGEDEYIKANITYRDSRFLKEK